MKRTALILTVALIASPLALIAESSPSSASSSSSSFATGDASLDGGAGQAPAPVGGYYGGSERPFSRFAIGGGVSPLGIQLETVTKLAGHFNLRGTGDFFNYTTNFTTSGINATAKLNLASARASLDVYPFRSGFHISPGILFANQNQVTAATDVAAGTSFTLNGQTYYSATANSATGATPITGTGVLGLNTNKTAFTATAGWGNMARGRGHWSVPVEAGVAFIGAPSVKVNLSGWACYDQAQTECADIASTTNPIGVAVQSNLTTQVAKWTSDLSVLKTYPIVSVGLAYSCHVR
jgi:hypothetical protein